MKMGWLLAGAMLLGGAAAQAEVLENDYVKITVDPQKGGAVTAMTYKKAATLPFIADKGVGVAGTGSFFTGTVSIGEKVVDLATVPMKPELAKGKEETVLKLTAVLPDVGPGFAVERVLSLGKGESGLRITDTYRNGGTGDVAVRVGANSRQQPEPWRLTLRCWFGDSARAPWKFTPYNAGDRATQDSQGKQVFWRAIGQYGVGFLYQVTAPQAPVNMVHALPKENGNPAEFQWRSADLTLPAGATAAVTSAILIDEGGREGTLQALATTRDRVVVTADLRRGGKVGEPTLGFGTAVSPVARKVKMVASTYFLADNRRTEPVKVGEADLVLEPGKAQFRRFEFTPDQKGIVYLDIAVLDEQGERLATSSQRAVVDGEEMGGEFGQTWKLYSRRLPEVRAEGTWAQMGEQLATAGQLKAARNSGPGSAERLAFYEKQFPYYAELLKGAAKALGVEPAKMVEDPGTAKAEALPAARTETACMGVMLNGPDGPINAYSKERSGSGVSGMGYCKLVPDKGYALHMYTLGGWHFGYGVNSAGLATSGASINCDAATVAAGDKLTAEWKAAGKPVAPIGAVMMLAMCKDVEEAIAFIENKEAPFEFTGNMLLVDRAGNAAILESQGIMHQIIRYPGKGVFASGNYPHERKDGLFKIGDNFGWAANTMLRERFIGEVMAQQKGQISLKDALWLMETHAVPGGMCQHVFENPAGLFSTCSCVAVARTGELFISHGPPCSVRTERYTLK